MSVINLVDADIESFKIKERSTECLLNLVSSKVQTAGQMSRT